MLYYTLGNIFGPLVPLVNDFYYRKLPLKYAIYNLIKITFFWIF